MRGLYPIVVCPIVWVLGVWELGSFFPLLLLVALRLRVLTHTLANMTGALSQFAEDGGTGSMTPKGKAMGVS